MPLPRIRTMQAGDTALWMRNDDGGDDTTFNIAAPFSGYVERVILVQGFDFDVSTETCIVDATQAFGTAGGTFAGQGDEGTVQTLQLSDGSDHVSFEMGEAISVRLLGTPTPPGNEPNYVVIVLRRAQLKAIA